MKLTIHKLDHAEGGYAFGTLWQEATNAVGHVVNGIVNGLQVTERTKQVKEYFGFKKEEDRHNFLNNLAYGGQKSDAGFYIVVVLIIAALGCGLFMAVKFKQNK